MVLSVCGDITPEQVLAIADRVLKPCAAERPGLPLVDEPPEAVCARVECEMPVSAPLFSLGYKEYFPPERRGQYRTPAEQVGAGILLDMLFGRGSPLYMRLMEEELINDGFGAGCYDGPGYAVWIFSGESRDPDAVAAAIAAELEAAREKGLDAERFEAARNALYGHMLFSFNDVEACAETLVEDVFAGRAPLAMFEAAAAVTLEDVQALLRDSLKSNACALSVVKRKDVSE
jgi:predicted Zn-dependent peptidase